MADILRITTPLVNKSQAPDAQKALEATQPFDLHNITRVTKPAGQEGMLRQNTGLNQQEETSALLLNLLKDPSVAASSLKNIYLLQELIKLLPVNNKPLTQEIQQLFDQLMVAPEDIADEMMRQENASTSFKGEMFDFLRELLSQNPKQEGLRQATVYFLKAFNSYSMREPMLHSVANSLEFLSDSLDSSKALSARLASLAARFRAPDAAQNFDDLKRDMLSLFKEVENSILFSPKLAKVLSIATYNLSRFNDNELFFHEATARLLSQLHGEQARTQFLRYIEQSFSGRPEHSRSVVETLAKLIDRQSQTDEIMLVNSEKVETIIRSLLSSPCNFTPLLHFVVPVQYEDMQSFAEIWINHNGGEDKENGRGADDHSIHMLLVFEISDIGRFELELYVRDKTIDLSLFCPPAYVDRYARMGSSLAGCLKALDFRLGDVHFEKLERARSLMDVFRSLPYKRTGIDVQI